MIVAFSTSSPWASVALIEGGEVRWSGQSLSNNRASEVCLRLLSEAENEGFSDWRNAQIFAADVGPGSFTGVRVGVMLAKTFAFTAGAKVAGADAFDLISPIQTVALPSKRGEYFVREAGAAPYRTSEPLAAEVIGYGPDFETPQPPLAAGFVRLADRLVEVDPLQFVPEYLIEPSISIPKKPYRHV